MKHDLNKKLGIFNKINMNKYLKEIKNNYRPYDPANYLYKKILEINNFENKFSDSFIELVYVTLSAWNMNSRGAKLAPFHQFKESLLKNKFLLTKLKNKKLGYKNKHELQSDLDIFKELFYKLDLVGKNKPRLVTFSKVMHFIFPELTFPIDRAYTLNFFYGHTNLSKDLEKQFEIFSSIFIASNEFVLKNNELGNLKDNNWNFNVPKIVDNLIIGWVRLNRRVKNVTKNNVDG